MTPFQLRRRKDTRGSLSETGHGLVPVLSGGPGRRGLTLGGLPGREPPGGSESMSLVSPSRTIPLKGIVESGVTSKSFSDP